MRTPKILVSVFGAITGALTILATGMVDPSYAFFAFGVVMAWSFGLHIFQTFGSGPSERLRWVNVASAAVMIGMSVIGTICAISAAVDGDYVNGIAFTVFGVMVVAGGTIAIVMTKLQPVNQPS